MRYLLILFTLMFVVSCAKKETPLTETEKEEVVQLEQENQEIESEIDSLEISLDELEQALNDLEN